MAKDLPTTAAAAQDSEALQQNPPLGNQDEHPQSNGKTPTAPKHTSATGSQQSSRTANRKAKTSSDHVLRMAHGRFKLIKIYPSQRLPDHPCTANYPIQKDVVEKIAKSLEVDGQKDPLTVARDSSGNLSILDGRHRYRAGGIEGRDIELLANVIDVGPDFDATNWVADRFRTSEIRRRLTASQLAVLAALEIPNFEEAAKKHSGRGKKLVEGETGGRSHELAAKKIGASASATKVAKEVIKWTFLKDAVKAGSLSLGLASRISELESEQKMKEALAAARKKDRDTMSRLFYNSTIVRDSNR
jgi:hypothetical protein